MAINRLRRPPHPVTLTRDAQTTLYEIELSAAPSAVWRAAFLGPPIPLLTARHTPELGRVGVNGSRVSFHTVPAKLHVWLRRIDVWIAYANSVVQA
jgi:hypothetical protein